MRCGQYRQQRPIPQAHRRVWPDDRWIASSRPRRVWPDLAAFLGHHLKLEYVYRLSALMIAPTHQSHPRRLNRQLKAQWSLRRHQPLSPELRRLWQVQVGRRRPAPALALALQLSALATLAWYKLCGVAL